MKPALNILWFEQDLRMNDNPALCAAIAQGNVLPIFIHDTQNAGEYALGAASRWWLHHSLQALNESLNGTLNFYEGDPCNIISALCERHNIKHVYWNRRYEPWRIARDTNIKQQLLSQGVLAESFNGSLLNEPWKILKKDGTPYKVFTPYHRKACEIDAQPVILSPPAQLLHSLAFDDSSLTLDALSLLPKLPWDEHFYHYWTPGENGANASLQAFIFDGLMHYKDGRDFPALRSVSKLSPHLHFGEISPQKIIATLKSAPDDNNSEHFIREIRWREFSYYLLFHWPDLPTENFKKQFNHFSWDNNPVKLKRWQQGLTGYPLVDAGMRELWKTGTMHNRVRMITASFLIKNLLIDWRLGAAWFWDCLVDADLASNSASWQWVAGSGTDASPYFRIFNPITQGEKFDPKGEYIKQYLPELRNLPNKYLFKPWEAPAEVLQKANITLGTTYPHPIVDIKTSRQQALDAYALTKQPFDIE